MLYTDERGGGGEPPDGFLHYLHVKLRCCGPLESNNSHTLMIQKGVRTVRRYCANDVVDTFEVAGCNASFYNAISNWVC
jgi:hypothetical protein